MSEIIVVGASNIDIQGFPGDAMTLGDSNPGRVRFSSGGVGRNIAENLARLGASVSFVSAFGDDSYSNAMREELAGLGVDVGGSLFLPGASASTYLCLLKEDGSLHAAVSDMEIIERLLPPFPEPTAGAFEGARLCVLDANLSPQAIASLLDAHPGLPFLLDSVSAAKAPRAKGRLGAFYAAKPNLAEAEVLTEIPYTDDEDLPRMADAFHGLGVKLCFISLGSRGLYYSDGSERGIASPPCLPVANASGAGDAMTAGIAWGILKNFPLKGIARFAVCAAALAARSDSTVNPDMSVEAVERLMGEKSDMEVGRMKTAARKERNYLELSKELREALAEGKPIVALESTIISHGMPYPRNVETALAVEAKVRSRGAVPATIAVIGGKLKAGLSADEIEYLGKSGRNALKASRRDLPALVASKGDGATTVAGTMIIAAMAGIRVFATGGIGGVHRGAPETFDISADLEELTRTEVAVVCAGAKSILDLGLTLEYLETRGIPVIGFGTDEFPAFYTRKSGFKLVARADSAKEIAAIMDAKWGMGLGGGLVVANPIPEEDQMYPQAIEKAISTALEEAKARGIKGKDATPYLLGRIKDLTGGDSLEANIKLVLNNASVAADIAAEYQAL